MRAADFATLTAASAIALCATAVKATTLDFTYYEGATPVATGSFSYTTGLTGVLSFADLSSFNVTLEGVTYDLAEVDTLTDYVWFAYDTATNSFDTNTNACGFAGCGFQESLGAVNSSGTDGFFFNPAPGAFTEYSSGLGIQSFDSIVIGTPEPATWALMLGGFAGLGAALRSRRRLAAA